MAVNNYSQLTLLNQLSIKPSIFLAVDEDLAGTDCLAGAGWMVITVECMHVPVEGNAGTDCLTVAGEKTAICISDTAWMHPSDSIVVKGIADTVHCTAAGCIVVASCVMADVGLTGAEHVFTMWEEWLGT